MTARRNAPNRKGNILVLMCFLLPVLFMVSALTINLAYVQLSRTELMVATDAATRAGSRALSELQDVDGAIEAARITAAMNTVSGTPLTIDTADNAGHVQFGMAGLQAGSSRYDFTPYITSQVRSGAVAANALRINGNRMTTSGGAVSLPFPSFGLPDQVDLFTQSVAMQVDRDIALVLDRSGSMGWSPSWSWPSGYSPWNYNTFDAAVAAGVLYYSYPYYYYSSGVNSHSFQQWAWEHHFGLDTDIMPRTPWENLLIAVEEFLNVLDGTVQTEMVSLSSYQSSATTDLPLQTNYQNILDELDTLSPNGGTAIGYGIQQGVPTLYDPAYARPLAAKTVIVMTDGMHNRGTDPVTVAQNFINQYDFTIHTITFSSGADQVRMQNVANVGGGLHYHAETGAELVDVFRQIANNLPTIITQ
ncbi:MAG: VWA domain-containing protein [Planctomycetota bacterium]